MALKGDRQILDDGTDISFWMNEVAEAGYVTVFSTLGSGAAMDQSAALVTVSAYPSGQTPAGMLVQNMVNINQARQHLNWLNDEVNIGGKVCLLQRGTVVTNAIYPGTTPTVGNRAYLSHSGLLTPTRNATHGLTLSPLVGQFLSSKDEDGYCKVRVSLPQPTA